MKKHNNSLKKREPPSKRAKPRGPVQRDTKEVLAELVGELKENLDPEKVAATSAGAKHQGGELALVKKVVFKRFMPRSRNGIGIWH